VRFASLLSGEFTTMAVLNPSTVKSTEKETGKTHLCAVSQEILNYQNGCNTNDINQIFTTI
jgi:hypothetical protein